MHLCKLGAHIPKKYTYEQYGLDRCIGTGIDNNHIYIYHVETWHTILGYMYVV